MVHNIIMMLLVIILPLQLQTELSFGVSAPSKMQTLCIEDFCSEDF